MRRSIAALLALVLLAIPIAPGIAFAATLPPQASSAEWYAAQEDSAQQEAHLLEHSESKSAALDGSEPSSPSAEPSGSVEPSTGLLPFNFTAFPFPINIVPYSDLTFYNSTVTPRVDTGVKDAYGVRMRLLDGKLYNHVSRQATYGLDNLNAYRITKDEFYLRRAKLQAKRLIDRKVEIDGAWFHPYSFKFGPMTDPWYSALGQGYVLMLFSRLAEVTGDPAYRLAADRTFASYLIDRRPDGPWVSMVDTDGLLWLQEYPDYGPDYTYNGHMLATLAIYDYYWLTKDPQAAELFRGAVTTSLETATRFRQPGGRSLYCLEHRLTANAAYHEVHVYFFLKFFRFTSDVRLARFADLYESDFARPLAPGTIRVARGKHVLVRPGRSNRTMTLSSATRFKTSKRTRLVGRTGYWFNITSGPWSGYWIRERAPYVYHMGKLARLEYRPRRILEIPRSGTYAFRKYTAAGDLLSTRYLKFPATSDPSDLELRIIAQAVVRGRPAVQVVGGTYGSSWIELRGVTLR